MLQKISLQLQHKYTILNTDIQIRPYYDVILLVIYKILSKNYSISQKNNKVT